ncbi:hypothetical protein FF38_12434 [Lucilia cuprina]|uniref:Spatacsin C-terminal domain-containing protein n=1 Tax=Lucilia cuprina TaxID=7375 RepID=A0A0L0CHC2_LUCCU|nr:hypothetical protein FF38_12434 [Lucilia cuprina]
MANNERDKIFKSWSGITEIALIKEVATKGEHIQLCIQYWARKRKMSVTEYELFFHDVVQTYVNRLLTERLVCKAENVLRNVQRDVKCFYYQYACESNDPELRELLMEHLMKREPCDDYKQLMQNLKFHWELLQQIKQSETIMANIKKHMRRVNLESLMSLDSATQQRLMIELYFETYNTSLLQHINKFVMWDFLVETKQLEEIIRWCRIQLNAKDSQPLKNLTELELKYSQWSLESEMYKYALRSLQDNSDNVLRNYFASAGYFFEDEINSVPIVLQRISLTESFQQNNENIQSLPLARFIFDQKLYYLLLYDFVGQRQLEELSELLSEHRPLLKFLVALKANSFEDLEGFKEISFYATKYLESVGIDFEQEQALATLFEFLTTEPSISNLQCSATSGTLKPLTYLKIIHHQQSETTNTIEQGLPNVYDLLNTFKELDYKRLTKDYNLYGKFSSFSEQPKQDGKVILPYTCRLNFLHYIKQSRCSYAVYLMLLQQLQNYAQITETHLFSACECVYDMALQSSSADTEVITHCIAFCEMLGFDTQQLRCFFKLKKCLISGVEGKGQHSENIVSILQKSERVLIQRLKKERSFPLTDYSAIMCVNAVAKHVNKTGCEQVSLVMQHYATLNDYWRLLVLLQYFDISLDQIKQLVKYFTIQPMGEHLLRALSFATQINERNTGLKRRTSLIRRQLKQNKQRKKENKTAVTTTSMETMTSSFASCHESAGIVNDMEPNNDRFVADCSNGGPDLFALIILFTNTNKDNNDNEKIDDINKFLEYMQQKHERTTTSTVVNYLRTAVEQQLPIMAVLAASINVKDNSNLVWCWLVWLAVTTNQWNNVLRLAVGINIHSFPWNLIEQLVRQCQIKSLVRSFYIFYPQNALIHLFNFMQLTLQGEFGDKAVHELRLYALAWSNDEVRLPLNPWSKREKLMKRTIWLLLSHLKNNFESITDQMKFLTCVCQSGLSDITSQLDFCLLRGFCEILQSAGNEATQRFPLNFIELIQNETGENKEYERVLNCVLAAKEYDIAIRLATHLHKPISDIVYSKWVNSLELQLSLPTVDNFDNYKFPFEQYEQEVDSHSLPPETLVNFLLYASSRLPAHAFRSRYYVLQKALNVIKHHHLFPNESFDRDQIEYDMIINYLLLGEDDAATLTLYHSEYYEEIMLVERCVLYKSFLELKELAGIDDLNISSKSVLNDTQKSRLESLLHRLLDDGDIVEALRLQELFDVRPLDLRFVVFCMALAESMSNIYAMSPDERQLLAEIERSSFSKFTKRTLCTTSGGGSGSYLSDSCSTLEFEEIPSKEKQETLAVLQGIASKLKFGVTIAKRVICCYRAAMYLDKEYLDVLRTKDVQILLQSIAEEGCLHRLLVVSDILTSTHMEPQEIAELLAFEITTAVVRPRFYIFSPDQQAKHMFRNADLWGYNIDRDLHLFLELTPDRTKLGACLLEYCDALKLYRKYQDNKPFEKNIYFERLAEIIAQYGQPNSSGSGNNNNNSNNNDANQVTRPPQVLSHKKQNIIYVELLIKAHQAFVHECSMEGIANVLNRAKVLNSILAQAKSWSLIVRMLIGIGRYREMFFCFDTLIENEQFESLLGQFDVEKTIGLRQAILAYLREYCDPQQGKELFNLAALNFLMYKDLAELWEQDAAEILNKIYNTYHLPDDADCKLTKLKCNSDMINLLNSSLEYYVHATENYLLDNKLLLAQKSASLAELTAMQIDLANRALEKATSPGGLRLCICVINLKTREQFKTLVNNELSVYQTLILSRAYGFDINWSEALIYQFVIKLKRSYLNDFIQQVDITDDIIENAIKCFQLQCNQQTISKEMEEHISELIDLVQSVTLKYKLASLLTLKTTILTLINDQTIHYLRDMKFGRREENRNT